MAQSKYKPISFTTTMRNPERIGYFLKCLARYEGQILNNDLIDDIVFDIIREKLYKPTIINSIPEYSTIYNSEESFSDTQLADIVEKSPQQHKEAGFDAGWPSRFDTWYKITMEFGFANYAIDEPIKISETGHMLIDAILEEKVNDEKIQNIFLNTMAKYQTSNPYRKVLNDNVPLVLLLQVIKMFRDSDESFSGISRQELSLFICWPNNNARALYELIKKMRKDIGVSKYTDEVIYNTCLAILGYGEEGKNYIKIDKVVGEAVDEYIRKMRITGIISLRGNGRFIDWNTLKLEKIEHVLNDYSDYELFKDPEEYYNYMGSIDPVLLERETGEDDDTIFDIRQATLSRLAEEYTSEMIYKELENVSSKKESKDELLKFIPAPARYEFLVSIALVQSFPDLIVKPNYPIDDEGIPTSTASGGMGDIECEDSMAEIIEVTLMQGRAQVSAEMLPITRHLIDLEQFTKKDKAAIFIAPSIHADAKRYTEWIRFKENVIICPYTTVEFIEECKNKNTLSELINV